MSNSNLVRSYLIYVMYFLGVGLISGSIVHMPIDPTRYSIIMLVGIVLFTLASYLSEVYVEKKNLTLTKTVKLLFFSLLLSLGIGMMSGGIQHFEDVKEYAPYLITSGFGLSLFSFIFKNEYKLGLKKFSMVVVTFVILALPLSLTLSYMTDQDSKGKTHQEDGHGHSH